MNESVRSNSKRSCAILTIVEIISLQSRDNMIRFDDYVTTSMPDRDVTGHTKCVNVSQPFTKTINSVISILSINHTWQTERLQRSTPSSRFLDSFHLPWVWRQKNHQLSEVVLPSLDELFQLQPTTDNGTSTTSTTTSTPTPTTTMTQRGGAKLVLDGYTYMRKRDLKKRDWICTKRDRRRNDNNGIIEWGWWFQKSIHIKILDDKQV
jgi:hypothetical protein